MTDKHSEELRRERIKSLARWLHNTYENEARMYGWETQEKTRVRFADLPEENAKTMLAVSREIYNLIESEKRSMLDDMREYNDRLYQGDGWTLTRAFLDIYEHSLKGDTE